VQQLTKEAALNADAAERRFSRVTVSCGPTAEAGSLRGKISDKAYDLAGFEDPEQPPPEFAASAKPDDLALIASVVTAKEQAKAAIPKDAATQLVSISETLLGICDVDRLQGLIYQINGRAGRTLVQ
jgi:hypothetical protein